MMRKCIKYRTISCPLDIYTETENEYFTVSIEMCLYFIVVIFWCCFIDFVAIDEWGMVPQHLRPFVVCILYAYAKVILCYVVPCIVVNEYF